MKIDLSGKQALITGSSRGLGAGIAGVMAQAGAHVILHCHKTREEAEILAEDIESQGFSRPSIYTCDVSDPQAVKDMFSHIRVDLGPIDILINNAGTSGSTDIFNTTIEDWQRLLNINLASVFFCCKEVVQDMRERKWGRIIQISSIVARQGALFGHVHYAATKSGMIGFTKTLARTMASSNVTVNALGVGMVETELLHRTLSSAEREDAAKRIALGRFCKPEEVGYLCAFLSSDMAAYITGAFYDINGGMVMDG